MSKLVIIYYHEVVEKGHGYSYQKIEKDRFLDQMRYLRDEGYQTMFFSQLNEPLPDKAAIVSFDDGFRSVFEHAAPIMEENGILGNVYLPTAYIGNNPVFMNWEQVRQMQKKGRFEMQAHTHTHVDVRTLTEEALLAQIAASDEQFWSQLGCLPKALCLPYGVYDRASVRTLRKIGRYEYILGSYYGTVSSGKLTDRVLPRIGISNDDSMEVFLDKLEGRYNWKGPLQRLRLELRNLKKERITNYEY